MIIEDLRDRRYSPPPPTRSEREASLKERQTVKASFEAELVHLDQCMRAAVAAQQRHEQEIERLKQERERLAAGPRTGLWIDLDGVPTPGVSGDASARIDALGREIAASEKRHQDWVWEVAFWWENRRGVRSLQSERSVASCEILLQAARHGLAITQMNVADLERSLGTVTEQRADPPPEQGSPDARTRDTRTGRFLGRR